jgi:hypothetical protein
MESYKSELDGTDRILNRVAPYLPASVVTQIKRKGGVSPVDSIRLLSLLPPEAYEGFPDMPPAVLTFPRDHNRHYFQASEWFYLAFNVKTVANDYEDRRRIGGLSCISGHTVEPQNKSLFALEKTNQLFRHSFQITLGATESKSCEHWYIRDKGGFIGDYRPSVHNELPVLTFGHDEVEDAKEKTDDEEEGVSPTQGLMPWQDEDGEPGKQMRWFVKDEQSGAAIDLILTIPDDVGILLQGPDKSGTITKPDFGINYMYYSFPYLKARGFISVPNDENGARTVAVTGAAWLDHQGGVVKPTRGLVRHLDEWKTLFKMPQHRLAWIWTMAQFPQKMIFLSGTAIPIQPTAVKKEATFPWRGSIMTRNGNVQYYSDGILTVKAVFQSPSIKSIFYATEVEISVAAQVFSLSVICKDQRAFPADQGEIYEGASDAEILSDNKTIKPKGVGFIENMSFTTYRQLEDQQLKEIGVAPLVGDFNGMITGNPAQTAHSVTGPIIVITCLVLILAVAGGMWWSRR